MQTQGQSPGPGHRRRRPRRRRGRAPWRTATWHGRYRVGRQITSCCRTATRSRVRLRPWSRRSAGCASKLSPGPLAGSLGSCSSPHVRCRPRPWCPSCSRCRTGSAGTRLPAWPCTSRRCSALRARPSPAPTMSTRTLRADWKLCAVTTALWFRQQAGAWTATCSTCSKQKPVGPLVTAGAHGDCPAWLAKRTACAAHAVLPCLGEAHNKAVLEAQSSQIAALPAAAHQEANKPRGTSVCP